MKRFAAFLLVMPLVAAAPAAAQEAPVPTPVPAPVPAPAAGKLSISAAPSGRRAVLTRDALRVRGTLSPAVPGQEVAVRIYTGGRKVFVKKVLADERTGAFTVVARLRHAGRHVIRASHRASPEVGTAVARGVSVDALPRTLGAGSGRDAVRAVQQRLRRLGYVTRTDGRFDARSARAVLAFRKVTGLSRTSAADVTFMRRLASGAGAFKVRHPRHGRHVEADLTRQVIALIDGGKVRRIYPTSSGAPVTPTVLGSYRIYEKRPGTNALGMVFSLFFIRGYAIHGYHSVPTFPASHGCLRVPVPDAVPIYDWLRVGDRVDVYYRS